MTNRELITAALRMLTVLAAAQSANAEDAALGLDELNDLMADLYTTYKVDLGYVKQDTLNNDVPFSDDDIASIKPLLAMRLHPYFPDRPLPPTVVARANSAELRLIRDAVLENMEEASMTNIPLGESNVHSGNILTGD